MNPMNSRKQTLRSNKSNIVQPKPKQDNMQKIIPIVKKKKKSISSNNTGSTIHNSSETIVTQTTKVKANGPTMVSNKSNDPKKKISVVNTANDNKISKTKLQSKTNANTSFENNKNRKSKPILLNNTLGDHTQTPAAKMIQSTDTIKNSIISLSHTAEQASDTHNDGSSSTKPLASCSDQQTQTDIDNQAWINMRDGFIDKICQQDKMIQDLQNQVKSLELLLKDPLNRFEFTNIHPQPEHVSPSPQPALNNITKIKSCFIIGDSHIRGIRDKIAEKLPSTCTVESFYQPGAGFQEIAKTQVQCPGLINENQVDAIVMMCGTCDVNVSSWDSIQQAIDVLLMKFKPCRQLCIIGIPFRYNIRRLNFHIRNLNTKIKNYVKSKVTPDSFSFVDPAKFLKTKDYKFDGIHLNVSGKIKLSNRISNVILRHFTFLSEQLNQKSIGVNSNSNLSYSNIVPTSTSTQVPSMAPHFDPHAFNESTFNSTPLYISNPTPISVNSYTPALQMQTPSFPANVNRILNNQPSYYRFAHVSVNHSFSSPIPTITPGHNRVDSSKFIDSGQTITT